MIIYQLLIIFSFIFLATPVNAQEIKYSFGARCKENKVICANKNEVPVCTVLDPRIHIENYIKENQTVNRYEPSCGNEGNTFKPGCIDLLNTNENNELVDNVTIECIEIAKCEANKENKLSMACSDGKIAKCLGQEESPNCENNTICEDGALPICEYAWTASTN